MRNPYCIDGPAIISFSGGRTSAMMLMMAAHDQGERFCFDEALEDCACTD